MIVVVAVVAEQQVKRVVQKTPKRPSQQVYNSLTTHIYYVKLYLMVLEFYHFFFVAVQILILKISLVFICCFLCCGCALCTQKYDHKIFSNMWRCFFLFINPSVWRSISICWHMCLVFVGCFFSYFIYFFNKEVIFKKEFFHYFHSIILHYISFIIMMVIIFANILLMLC